jgi:hypothetical protein
MGAAASSPRRTLPRSFRKIRLELAREKGRPAGSASSGYIIVAPLDQDRRFDPEVWKEYRDACRVVRFRPGEDDDIGHLVHRRGGSWAFHYDIRGDEDDEASRSRYDPYLSCRVGRADLRADRTPEHCGRGANERPAPDRSLPACIAGAFDEPGRHRSVFRKAMKSRT